MMESKQCNSKIVIICDIHEFNFKYYRALNAIDIDFFKLTQSL